MNLKYINNSTLYDQNYVDGVKCPDYINNCTRRMKPLPSDYTPRLYQTVAFDWRNHGESDHSPNFSIDWLATDLVRFLYDYSVSQKSESASDSSNTTAADDANSNNESCCSGGGGGGNKKV